MNRNSHNFSFSILGELVESIKEMEKKEEPIKEEKNTMWPQMMKRERNTPPLMGKRSSITNNLIEGNTPPLISINEKRNSKGFEEKKLVVINDKKFKIGLSYYFPDKDEKFRDTVKLFFDKLFKLCNGNLYETDKIQFMQLIELIMWIPVDNNIQWNELFVAHLLMEKKNIEPQFLNTILLKVNSYFFFFNFTYFFFLRSFITTFKSTKKKPTTTKIPNVSILSTKE